MKISLGFLNLISTMYTGFVLLAFIKFLQTNTATMFDVLVILILAVSTVMLMLQTVYLLLGGKSLPKEYGVICLLMGVLWIYILVWSGGKMIEEPAAQGEWIAAVVLLLEAFVAGTFVSTAVNSFFSHD